MTLKWPLFVHHLEFLPREALTVSYVTNTLKTALTTPNLSWCMCKALGEDYAVTALSTASRTSLPPQLEVHMHTVQKNVRQGSKEENSCSYGDSKTLLGTCPNCTCTAQIKILHYNGRVLSIRRD